jgi:hypothetical protein
MSVRTDDDESDSQTVGLDAPDFDSYREVLLDDGGIIIYDDDADGAWIQSTAAVALESMA